MIYNSKKITCCLSILTMLMAVLFFAGAPSATSLFNSSSKSEDISCHDSAEQNTLSAKVKDCECEEGPLHDHSDCGDCHISNAAVSVVEANSDDVVTFITGTQINSGFHCLNLNPREHANGLFRPPISA